MRKAHRDLLKAMFSVAWIFFWLWLMTALTK